ncbi:MAG: 2-C-methyl-D-erythritol 2,4-cyclodiphosphate synthase [Candidatus Omnitrophota bacterium]
MIQKTGIGYDIHRLVEGRTLFLGGVEIPYVKGLLGHSDADVLIHAICDAMLGAAGESDIGEKFPDTDPKYENIRSTELLKMIVHLLEQRGWRINNIDAIIIAEEPKLMPFKKQISSNLAKIMHINEELVSIKGKTNEGLGEIGQKQAIASFAVVTLIKEG